jgi:hypothetical protein
MIVGAIVQKISIPHRGKHVRDYLDGAYTLVDQFETINEHREAMQAKHTTYDEAIDLATKAHALRYEPTEQIIAPQHLLYTRRTADLHPDLYTTFNKIQENLIKGGIRGTKDGHVKTIRAINSVNELDRINRQLWNLAEEALAA